MQNICSMTRWSWCAEHWTTTTGSRLVPMDRPLRRTATGSLQKLEDNFRSAQVAKSTADHLAAQLQVEIEALERGGCDQRGCRIAQRPALCESPDNAAKAMDSVRTKLSSGAQSDLDLRRLRQELDDRDEQAAALFESAAVGLQRQGLAYELRTHLTEIRQRTSALETTSKSGIPEKGLFCLTCARSERRARQYRTLLRSLIRCCRERGMLRRHFCCVNW